MNPFCTYTHHDIYANHANLAIDVQFVPELTLVTAVGALTF